VAVSGVAFAGAYFGLDVACRWLFTRSAFSLLVLLGPVVCLCYILNLDLAKHRGFAARLRATLHLVFAYALVACAFALTYLGACQLGGLIVHHVSQEPLSGFGDFFYFSVVTGSTLGYGDLLPMNRFTRSLVCLQVIEVWVFLVVGGWMMSQIVAGSPDGQ
jgi:hypothetical protein